MSETKKRIVSQKASTKRMPKCAARIHPQEGDWSFKVNGKRFCRGCVIYWVMVTDFPTQADNMMGKPGLLDGMDIEDVKRGICQGLRESEHLAPSEAERLLDWYVAREDETGQTAHPDRVERLQAISEGDLSELFTYQMPMKAAS